MEVAFPAFVAAPAEIPHSQASDLSIWDDLPSGFCTPVEYRQCATTQGKTAVASGAEKNANVDDLDTSSALEQTAAQDDALVQDDTAGSFQLFDIGNPWTQADPSTQVQRKQWLRGCNSTQVPSSDHPIELDLDSDEDEDQQQVHQPAPRSNKRKRSSIQDDDQQSQPAQAVGDRSESPMTTSATTAKEDQASNPPPVLGRTEMTEPPKADSTLSAQDQQALESFVVAGDDAHLDPDTNPPRSSSSSSSSSSDDFEILTTPPPALRRRGLARMLSDLKPEQKHGYWSQFDDYVPPSERGSRSVPNDHAPVTPWRHTDSRLLPNPIAPTDAHDDDDVSTSSQLDDTPLIARQRRIPQHQQQQHHRHHHNTPLDTTPAHARIQRLDAQSPGTLIARSRNATGMGLATKTWESTWKARGVRIVKGRTVKSACGGGTQEQRPESPLGRGAAVRARRGRGRGRGSRRPTR